MGRVEHLRQFHPDRRQIVHVEEPPVIDFFRRDPPEREPIRLIVQERIERIETARIAGFAVDLFDCLDDRRLDLQRFLATPLEPALDDFLFSRAFRDPLRIGLSPPWQIFQRGDDALEFREEIRVLERRQFFQRDLENVAIGAGSNRELVFVVAKIKRARFEPDLQFAPLQNAAVLIAENR